jgi:glyoxylase-like metal-dependent hydrolase (beta-lactamase superfamily II)
MPVRTHPPVTWRDRLEDIRLPTSPAICEVAPRLWRVRTRGAQAYLVMDTEITVIDTGVPGSGSTILEAVHRLGRSTDEIRRILVTHFHFDHVGGLAELQQATGAATAIHVAEVAAVESKQPLPNPFMSPVLARITEPYLEFKDPGSTRVDMPLRDGDELPGLGGIRVVHTPGHTPGSISLLFRELGVVMVGDAMQFRFGRLALPNRMFTQDMDEAIGSIRKLARLDFDTLAFSHYRPINDTGREELRAFARTLVT